MLKGQNSTDADLNSVIASAVSAKIQTQVAAALSGDETMGQYVAAALQQEVQPDRYSSHSKTTFLNHVVAEAIRKATEKAVHDTLEQHQPQIKAKVQEAVLSKLGDLADGLVDQAIHSTGYQGGRVNVSVDFKRGD